MSIFDKFTKSKENEKVVSKPETTSVDVDKVEIKAPTIKKEVKTEVRKESSVKVSPKNYGILVRPIITEKATNQGKKNQYVFEVSLKANKIQISQAIEARYGVKPIRINVLNVSGKNVTRGRDTGRTKDWRKAVVFLPAGKNIQIHEGV